MALSLEVPAERVPCRLQWCRKERTGSRLQHPVPELYVWPSLTHSLTHVPSLAWNSARTGEKTSEVTVKYLKMFGRKK